MLLLFYMEPYSRMDMEVPSEYQECLLLYQWSQLNPKIGEYLIKNVNEGKRTISSGYNLKRIGLRPGLPDYQLIISNHKYHCLWIEMKRRNANQHSRKNTNQDDWIKRLNAIHHYATYAYGFDDAVRIINDYLSNRL